MNKKLVAVAVAGVLAAPLAAQAQTANVTLYGRLNIDYELVNGRQANGSNPNVSRLSSNSSRLGVRGVESLGGGLNAIFQIESNVSGDTGNSSSSGFASRDTFVGLQGSWGTFKMGKFLMPYDDLHPIFGNVPTYTTSILSTATLWANGAQSKFNGGFDARLGNSVRYDSPVWSGFNFSSQVSMRDSSGFADNPPPTPATNPVVFGGDNGDHTQELRHAYVWGVAGYYNNGPIQAGVGYEHNNKVRGPTLDDWAFSVTGAYNFGVVRIAGIYERLNYDVLAGGDLKRNFWGVSATAPIGPGALYAFYGAADDGKGSAADGQRVGGLTRGSDTGSQQWEISYTYPLSKRTQVYAGYVKIQNDSRAAYSFNINGYSINTTCVTDSVCPNGGNGKPGGLVLGMIHLF
ncbi:MAG: porin [Casimicrobiaceae bacterium]